VIARTVGVEEAMLLGAATGLRSQAGVAALLTRRDLSRLPPPWSRLDSRGARIISMLTAGGEILADKLPTAPPRTKPGPLAARIATGLLVGMLADASAQGRVRAQSAVPAALAGGSAAAATSLLGQSLRTRLSKRLPALAVAGVEDVVAIALAVVATSSD
jgi:uncharacterized membrane protein